MTGEPAARGERVYVPALDGLRALSIALVVGEHSALEPYPPFRLGYFGVDVFFVLSGYLITSLLRGEQRATGGLVLKKFYARRFLRIVPALWAWAAVLLVTRVDPPASVLWSVLWISNIVLAAGAMPSTGGAPVSWSLSIEEQFYALWPPLGKRLKPAAWAGVAAAVIVAITVWRAVLVSRGITGFPLLSARPDAHLDVILWGCLAALVEETGTYARVREFVRARRNTVLLGLAAAAVGTYALAAVSDRNVGTFGFTLVAVLTAAFILWLRAAPGAPLTKLLSLAPVVFVGRISYGIYLWHRPAVYWLYDPARAPLSSALAGWPGAARDAVLAVWFVGAILLWSSVSWFVIERPFLRLKERFEVLGERRIEAATIAR
ncbi:MAG TPA: acyltransferase [Thermoanaerobaculia bacterium]|nr:acyltransferase [Thermoanaerobaculia bacterium]